MSAQQPAKSNRAGLPPVTAAVRQRLQAVFEHGQRCAEKADYDYAHDLFTQCLVEDPANLIYLQHFLGNLAQKYGNNKKGARFAGAEDRRRRGWRSTRPPAKANGAKRFRRRATR